jgi:hypothetical protein
MHCPDSLIQAIVNLLSDKMIFITSCKSMVLFFTHRLNQGLNYMVLGLHVRSSQSIK